MAVNNSDHRQDRIRIEHPRSLVFEIAALVGELSALFLTRVPLDPRFRAPPNIEEEEDAETNDDTIHCSISTKPKSSSSTALEDPDVAKKMGAILLKLLHLCHALDLRLVRVVRNKMKLNNKKYPASLCKGKSGKYTKYSAVTGITKGEGQSTLDENDTTDDATDNVENKETVEDFLLALDQLTLDIGTFATERLWSQYHKPRNLLLALLGELGEVRCQ